MSLEGVAHEQSRFRRGAASFEAGRHSRITHCGPDTVSGVPSVKRVDLEGTISNPGAVPKPKLPCNRVPGHVGQFDIARCIAL